jgi:hypothetical protein
MWPRRMKQRLLAAISLTMISQHYRETRKSRSDDPMGLRGAKILLVELRANESYFTVKGGAQQIKGAATTSS